MMECNGTEEEPHTMETMEVHETYSTHIIYECPTCGVRVRNTSVAA